MLVVHDAVHLAAAREFADRVRLRVQLERQLDYVATRLCAAPGGADPSLTRCHVYPARFPAHSFDLLVERRDPTSGGYTFLVAGVLT